MIVGTLYVELHIPMAESLKDKRSAVKGLKEQLRAHFNVSASELDANEKWQRAALGIAAVGDDRRFVENCLQHVADWIRRNQFVSVIRIEQEYW